MDLYKIITRERYIIEDLAPKGNSENQSIQFAWQLQIFLTAHSLHVQKLQIRRVICSNHKKTIVWQSQWSKLKAQYNTRHNDTIYQNQIQSQNYIFFTGKGHVVAAM